MPASSLVVCREFAVGTGVPWHAVPVYFFGGLP